MWLPRLKTYRLKGLPHTPSPFSCPLNLLPLCIFKPSETPTAPPSHPPHRGGGWSWGLLSPAPEGLLSQQQGQGAHHKPMGPRRPENKPQALGTEPTRLGATGDLPTAVGAWLTGCQARRQAQGWVVYTEAQYLGDGLAVIEKRMLDVGLGHPGPNSTSDWLLCHCVIRGEMIHLLELRHFPLGERVSSRWPEHQTEPSMKSPART